MNKTKMVLSLFMVLAMIGTTAVPAMAGIDVGAYRERMTTGADSVLGSARDGNLRGTVTTSIILDTGTTGEVWVAADVSAYANDETDAYTWSESYIESESSLDDVGVDVLSASSDGNAVVTYNYNPVVLTTSYANLQTSLNVGGSSLRAETSGYLYSGAYADTLYGTDTYNEVYGTVDVGTDDNLVYAYAWGESEDPVFASISLDASVTVNGETATATLDGSATSSAVVVP